jgi:hypothetical protein
MMVQLSSNSNIYNKILCYTEEGLYNLLVIENTTGYPRPPKNKKKL